MGQQVGLAAGPLGEGKRADGALVTIGSPNVLSSFETIPLLGHFLEEKKVFFPTRNVKHFKIQRLSEIGLKLILNTTLESVTYHYTKPSTDVVLLSVLLSLLMQKDEVFCPPPV